MLRTLYIENIAVIEKTSIDFENGLNVLTGETGAGKSIIIDAINAIMGQRTSKEIIRTEADSAFVSAQFDDINQNIVEKLDELGFSDDEEHSFCRELSTETARAVVKSTASLQRFQCSKNFQSTL